MAPPAFFVLNNKSHVTGALRTLDAFWQPVKRKKRTEEARERPCPQARGRLHQATAPPHQEKDLPALALSPGAARQPHAHPSASDPAPLHQGSHPVDQRSS